MPSQKSKCVRVGREPSDVIKVRATDDVHAQVATPLARDLRKVLSPAEVASAVRAAVANPESYRSAIADAQKAKDDFERWAREKEAAFIARIEAASTSAERIEINAEREAFERACKPERVLLNGKLKGAREHFGLLAKQRAEADRLANFIEGDIPEIRINWQTGAARPAEWDPQRYLASCDPLEVVLLRKISAEHRRWPTDSERLAIKDDVRDGRALLREMNADRPESSRLPEGALERFVDEHGRLPTRDEIRGLYKGRGNAEIAEARTMHGILLGQLTPLRMQLARAQNDARKTRGAHDLVERLEKKIADKQAEMQRLAKIAGISKG